ncbi:sulfotransferase, partial [Pelagibacteraceae bacterium]|nr:sulfotransferase [Pelagibacteraceae bacterium]
KLIEITKLSNNIFSKEKKYLFFINAQFHEAEQNFNEAKQSYKNSILCDTFYFDPYINLLNLYEITNDILSLKLLTESAYKNFKSIDQKNILNFFESLRLNRENKFQESANFILNSNLETAFKSNKNFQIRLLNLESKNNERLKKYNEAFNKIEKRNSILLNLNENKKYNKRNILDTIEKYKHFFVKKNLNKITSSKNYNKDKNLIFLVGFPRSGTTLLDTILRSHSKIKVLEEEPILLNLRHEFFKRKNNNLTNLLKITETEKNYIRHNYLKKIILNKLDEEKIIIDKLPLSIIEIGFIKIIFPNAKIILAMRHPCDVITSCFFTSFKINDSMINFLKIDNTIDFYNNIFSLFEIYEKEINFEYTIAKYEDIVHNFKHEITCLLKFLGLEYEAKLEKFYLTALNRPKISTPSYNQVINPLYQSSIGRWKNYKKISKLKSKLNKWILKYGY